MNLCSNFNKKKNDNIITYKNKEIDKTDDICVICLDIFDINQKLTKIKKCGHVYHRDCISSWFKKKERCPICNYELS